jgi:tRNA(adenine34) deaminase
MTYTMFSDEYFMNEALKEARKARYADEVPVGAIIVAENKIIARAYNQTQTLVDVTAHAEMLAITSAANNLGSKYLHHCTLYVTLEPCVMCGSATAWAQLSRIVFGARDPKAGYSTIIQNILHSRTKVKAGILEQECSELLVEFFKKKR